MFSKIKEAISNGDLVIAIADLRASIGRIDGLREEKRREFSDQLVLISSQLAQIENEIIAGTANLREVGPDYTRIAGSVLRIINKAENSLVSSRPGMKAASGDLVMHNDDELTSSAFARNYDFRYQHLAIGLKANEANELEEVVFNILKSRVDKHSGIWSDGMTKSFDLQHVNTSVAYYFLQRGMVILNDPFFAPVINFLDTITEVSIPNRAKFYFDIQTNRISDRTSYDFVKTISQLQIVSGDLYGAFKAPDQGEAAASDSPNKEIGHYGGYTFHTLLICDALLHLNPNHSRSNKEAARLLEAAKSFFEKVMEMQNGYLVDRHGNTSPQLTTWYYVLAFSLGSSLPERWQANMREMLEVELGSFFKRTMMVLNFSLLLKLYPHLISYPIRVDIIDYFEKYHKTLKEKVAKDRLASDTSINISLYGRALLYMNQALGNKI
ncbi:hypothetical protein [Neolewinella persica]|uniref:hypothetical protein n=1 Tax=Neolewinella persica TaxID=70998 RepID=UPI00037ECF8E|nr:hypothetical protein [Neolewinella persica]